MVAQALDGGALVDRALAAGRPRDRAARGRLGDHLAVHAPPDPDRDGGARDAGGRRARGGSTSGSASRRSSCATPTIDVEAGRGDEGGGRDRPRRARRRRGRHGRQGLLGARAGAAGRRRGAALGRAALLRRHRADDAARLRAGGRRPADRLDHDAGVRPLRARRAGGGRARSRFARPRLHDRRLDRRGPRAGPRRRARDRRHVPGEQGPEHPGRRGHAARVRRADAGRDPPGRRGDGAGRPAGREGGGHRRDPRQVQADRRHARGLHRRDQEYREAGCTHVMLELWGEDRLGQLRLFAERCCRRCR